MSEMFSLVDFKKDNFAMSVRKVKINFTLDITYSVGISN